SGITKESIARAAGRSGRGGGVQPAAELPRREVGQGVHPLVTLVERGNVAKFTPAGAEEDRLSFDRDLLQRFQAVADKARADHVEDFGLLAPELAEDVG